MLFQNSSKSDTDENNSKIGGVFQTGVNKTKKVLLYLCPGQAIFEYSRHFHNSWTCRKSVLNADHNPSNGMLSLLSTLAMSQLSGNVRKGLGQNDLDTCRESIAVPRHSAWDNHSETSSNECHSSELRKEYLG